MPRYSSLRTVLLHHAMVGNAPCQSHRSAGSGPQRQICNHNHPGIVLLNGEGTVLCWNVHEWLRDDPQGTYVPWQSTLATPHIPQVEFDIVTHSRPDGASRGTPLRRPPGKPPPFGTVRPDSVLDPGDQGSARLHRKTHDNDKGRGKSSLVGSQVGTSVVSRQALHPEQFKPWR